MQELRDTVLLDKALAEQQIVQETDRLLTQIKLLES